MSNQSAIINPSGDYEESYLRLAKHLGRDKNRRAVFNLVYGRGSKPRSKKQISDLLGVTGTAQIIQNALDELARHHLIVRLENKGQVRDGSRWVYAKDAFVRANRDKIVKYADNPGLAKKVPTKRRPMTEVTLSLVKSVPPPGKVGGGTKTQRPRKRAKLAIALLVTNPDRNASLQTMVEARDIEQAMRLAGRFDEVDLKVVLAPTLDLLIDTLNSYRPDVVHFSGHGGGRTLIFDNERAGEDGGTVLDFDMVARVVQSTSSRPRLLVLAACDTVDGADQFLDAVPAVIAMASSVDDEAACAFSARFYRSLSAGATISQSLEQAKLVLEGRGYRDAKLPTLVARDMRAAEAKLL